MDIYYPDIFPLSHVQDSIASGTFVLGLVLSPTFYLSAYISYKKRTVLVPAVIVSCVAFYALLMVNYIQIGHSSPKVSGASVYYLLFFIDLAGACLGWALRVLVDCRRQARRGAAL
jgi:hypothetical protein